MQYQNPQIDLTLYLKLLQDQNHCPAIPIFVTMFPICNKRLSKDAIDFLRVFDPKITESKS